MYAVNNTTYQNTDPDFKKKSTSALRMMLYMTMASITMLFAVTTSALLVKKADILNWAQFPLPNIFTISTVIAVLSSAAFYFTFRLYKAKKFTAFYGMLFISSIVSIGFLVSQLMGFNELEAMGFPLTGNVSGSFIYFLAIVHGLHIIVGLMICLVILIKFYFARKKIEFEGGGHTNPKRVLALELVTTYWHFVNVLWVYLFLFFYFNYQ